MNKLFVYLIDALVGAGVVFLTSVREPKSAYDPAFCAGPPLLTQEALADAADQGYDIDRVHHCIDKRTYAEITRRMQEDLRKLQEQASRQQADREKAASEPAETLSHARAGFYTAIAVTEGDHPMLPNPPSNLFVRADYTSNQQQLAAFAEQ